VNQIASETAISPSRRVERAPLLVRARGAIVFACRALSQALRTFRTARSGERLSLAGLVLRMRGKHFLTKLFPRCRFQSQRLFGWKMEFFDYFEVMGTFETVFLARDYRFQPTTRRPRILDCGSNIGLSLVYFKREYPEATIVAFEPDPVTFALLRRNVLRNGLTGIELQNLALGATPGPREFFHDPEKPGSGGNSFVQQSVVPVSKQVQVARLSDFVGGEFDLLKLDVEGAELEVVEDLAARGKLRLIRELVIEVHPGLPNGSRIFPGLKAFLEAGGFQWEIRSTWPEEGGNFTVHAARADANAADHGQKSGA